jgi:hypothetical protein
MKRFGNLFIVPFLIIICIIVFSGFGQSSNTAIAKDLLKERTSILQQAYYGQLDIDEVEERLYLIETQPLLESDILTLRNADSGQIDFIKKMEVISLKQTTKLYDYLSFQGQIKWYMTGLTGDYIETVEYAIVLKSYGRLYKISDLYPTNPYL